MLLEVLLLVLSVLLVVIYNAYKFYKPFFYLPSPPLLAELKLIKHVGSPRFPHAVYMYLRSLIEKYQKNDYVCYVHTLVPRLAVQNHELIEMILKDPVAFPKDPQYKIFGNFLGESTLVTINHTNWKTRRTLLNPAFHTSVLDSFMSTFNSSSMTLVKMLDSKKPIEVHSTLKRYTLEMICETTMGYKLSNVDSDTKYIKAIERTSELLVERWLNPLYSFDAIYKRTTAYQNLMKQVEIIDDFCSKIIKERKLDSTDVIGNRKRRMATLDLLISYQNDNQDITNDILLEEVKSFVVAGYHTTAFTLTMMLQCLGTHLEYQSKAIDEVRSIFGSDKEREITTEDLSKMVYLDCVIKEVLRLYPPVPLVARVAAKDFDLNGKRFPKGTRLLICIQACQMDPKVFSNSNQFEPDRFLSESGKSITLPGLFPFSYGPRTCIGQRFALMEIKVVIAQILRHFEVKALQNQVDLGVYIGMQPTSDVMIQFESPAL